MKNSIFFCYLCLLTASTSSAQNDINNIKMTISSFSEAGDKNDAAQLDSFLEANYRVVMNRLFGSEEVNVLSKAAYLEKIKSKEFGGDKREVFFKEIVINGSTAIAKVEFKGTKMTFTSLLTLLKDSLGHWKLISDVPVVS